MATRTSLSRKILFAGVLLVVLSLLLSACGRWTLTRLPPTTPVPEMVFDKSLILTAAVPELGTPETGRQNINLGSVDRPGRYILVLANDNPPLSGHWLEWDYLALQSGASFLWQIGQSETPPDFNYTGQVTDEFCSIAVPADCKTEFEALSGEIDDRSFPKTLNDGSVPAVKIGFHVLPEQIGADLTLTLSTLYSSHVPDTRDFMLRITLQGPF